MTDSVDSCPSCRGNGWKFLNLRRSTANANGVAEQEMLHRARTTCLACSGTGRLSS